MMLIKNKKNSISVIKGDLFDHVRHYVSNQEKGCSVIIPHVCNNVGAFGSGFVAAINKHYPIVRENYHLIGKPNLRLGYVQYVEVFKDKSYGHKLVFANMIAQNGLISETNPRPLNYYALCKCMASVAEYSMKNFDNDSNKPQIHCPKFGCGLAGGNSIFIDNLIEDIWKNIPVFVYQL
jgi:hypothetical protein